MSGPTRLTFRVEEQAYGSSGVVGEHAIQPVARLVQFVTKKLDFPLQRLTDARPLAAIDWEGAFAELRLELLDPQAGFPEAPQGCGQHVVGLGREAVRFLQRDAAFGHSLRLVMVPWLRFRLTSMVSAPPDTASWSSIPLDSPSTAMRRSSSYQSNGTASSVLLPRTTGLGIDASPVLASKSSEATVSHPIWVIR